MRIHLRIIIFFLLLLNAQLSLSQNTFTNPLLPSGADPWVIFKDGFYYYTNTLGKRIDIWKAKDLADLKNAERKTIWIPPYNTNYSKEIWAPEIHYLQGKWYVYFAADDGKNENHRIYVLENASEDPLEGEWSFKGKVADASDKWAIDASVFEHQDRLYLIWSGWQDDINGRQDIYIAEMENPWTIKGKRVMISKPEFKWERHGDLDDGVSPSHVDVNEGPQVLEHQEKIFIIYSASGCWTDFYTLGMLTTSVSANLLDSTSWTKSPKPFFQTSEVNDVWAPGHNSFFKSPDGTEDWILYHANDDPGQGCGRFRSPRAQKFYWNEDGTPNFGEPVKTGVPIQSPQSGR